MGNLNDLVTGLLIALFSTRGAALSLAALILLAATAILITVYWTRIWPLRRSLLARIADFPHTVRGNDLGGLEDVMMRPGREGWRLRRSWTAYRSGFVHSPDNRLRSAAPAGLAFQTVEPGTSVLGWWSNLFVAVGLILTFLGVVAALSEATGVLASSADPARMQAALSGLLSITATKFWTSIAGVASSVILRIFERRWATRIDRIVEDLCELIDDRIPPFTPMMLAAEQLNESRAQTRMLAELRDAMAGEARPAKPTAALDPPQVMEAQA